ncbi:translation elongation factor G [Schizosaccharomyces cryophilus OY26]|uniref:Translation elongation factor G n=1 Tax=Schizosaccharomyces cryophilus (strain OY26 / ATCC MYA-4695 / CBS 11777 / NBRC 106824 / NRRL Y48691) TaxID=653667 RepID=S9WXW8_SCHCR|nr:translation elongation factor G [Schizosaccharomyces cryophilus OY26]EPY49567.1 translation elongation factor G [Schizosaccharomyces cryophilus OY26]
MLRPLGRFVRSPIFLWKRLSSNNAIHKIRNVGIIAHIDAGKTTLTEKMLYYGGYTNHFGNVDTGNTVMDYLPSERERGITITSAAITFSWRGHTINLIDTPGHADFTFEVERSVAALDGAVAILDGSVGVEAQTKVVWSQATRYGIPKVIFVNKMDHIGSSLSKTMQSIYAQLDCHNPIVLQLPVFSESFEEKKFLGIIDVLRQKMILWDVCSDQTFYDGKHVREIPIPEEKKEEFQEAREAMVMTLCDLDETLCDEYLQTENVNAFSENRLTAALREQCITGNVVPVLCGSSLKNIGVQPAMDAIVDYLPDPTEVNQLKKEINTTKASNAISLENLPLYALVFKVIHTPTRGILTYIRVKEGTLKRGMMIYNPRTRKAERTIRLYNVYADQTQEVDEISAGNIGLIGGLKEFHTGDAIITKNKGKEQSYIKRENLSQLHIPIPEPVCMAVLEPDSLKDEPKLLEALANLVREDPSLRYTQNSESNQWILEGMGGLHLQISHQRLVNDFGARATLGKLQVGYRETITRPCSYADENEGFPLGISLHVHLYPLDEIVDTTKANHFQEGFVFQGWTKNDSVTFPESLELSTIDEHLFYGILAGLSHGPLYGFPLWNVQAAVHIEACSLPSSTSSSSLSPLALLSQAMAKATRQAVQKLYRQTPNAFSILEPYMDITITTPDEYIGTITKDLVGKRSAVIHEIVDESSALDPLGELASQENTDKNMTKAKYIPRETSSYSSISSSMDKQTLTQNEPYSVSKTKRVSAQVPMERMLDYNSVLKALAKGNAKFTMSQIQNPSSSTSVPTPSSSFLPMSTERQKHVFATEMF